ncbi:UNVERIFIED_CONTAM: hypothetical protein Sindi_2516300 [Sesamum indicum]
MHVVHSAIFNVNKVYASRVTYSWGYNHLDKLRKRYYTFQWVGNHAGVVWNVDERKVTAEDGINNDEEATDDMWVENPGWVDPPSSNEPVTWANIVIQVI